MCNKIDKKNNNNFTLNEEKSVELDINNVNKLDELKNEIDKLNNKINKLKNEINIKKVYFSKLEKKNINLKNENKDLNIRFQAEIENIYKRNQIDIKKIHKFAIEKFAISILPTIDNLHNILNNIKLNNENNSTYEGIDLTLKNFLSNIKKFGIKILDKVNIPFNPEYHQAMSILESSKDENIEDNIVVKIFQNGYIMNGRLLRPAMVQVYKKTNIKK